MLSAVLMRPVLAALNHILAQQGWASERLRAHAGRRVRIDLDGPLGRFSARCRILESGLLAAGPDTDLDGPDDVTLRLTLSSGSLSSWWAQGVDGLSGHLRVEGDVMLAATLAEVAKHLRWDVEEALSRVVGDAMAYRAASSARAGWQAAQGLARRSLDTLVRHWADDPSGVVDRQRARSLEQRLHTLEHTLEALERQAGARDASLQSASKSA
jgi:ubiquinone biosynthesis protein UbiJ